MKTVIRTFVFIIGVAQVIPSAFCILVNGGFEAGAPGLAVPIPGWSLIDTPDVSAPGGTHFVSPNITLASGIAASPNGGQFALLRNSPFDGLIEGLSQSVGGLTPGTEYLVTFFIANGGIEDFRPGFPNQIGQGRIDVTFAGVTQASPTLAFEGFGSQTWQTVTLHFLAAASTETLTFMAAGFVGGDASTIGRIALDGIAVTAVPEPSTYLAGALLVLGCGVQGFRSLRNRKRVA